VNHLKDALDGQKDLNKAFIKSLRKEEDHLLQSDRALLLLATKEQDLKSELLGFVKVNEVISAGLDNQMAIKDKLVTIQFVLAEGKAGRLSAMLINNAELGVELDEISKAVGARGLSPVFAKKDRKFIYTMPNAVTFIKEGVLHSIIAIPLIKLSEKFEAFTLNEALFEQLNKQTPRILLMERYGEYMAYITGENMANCTPRMSAFTCGIRVVKIFDTDPICVRQWNFCGEQEIPKTVVVETEGDKFLFSTNAPLNATLTCALGKSENYMLGNKGAIRVPKHCTLNAKSFMIQAAEDFESIVKKTFHLEQVNVPQLEIRASLDGDRELVEDLRAKIDVHKEQIGEVNDKLEEAQSKITTALNNSAKIEELASGTTWHFLPGYVASGLAVVCFIAIIFLVLRLAR
jgi:hypothetical protein